MRRATLCLPALLLLVLASACSGDDNGGKQDSGGTDSTQVCSSVALMPADSAVGDFKRENAPQVARNLTDLTALIDGGADKYTKGGKFICMALTKYISSTKTHTLELWIFDETDQAGAQATYDDTEHPDDTDLSPTIGDAARGHDNTVSDSYTADFRKGRYLVRLTADKVAGKSDALELLKAVATAIK